MAAENGDIDDAQLFDSMFKEIQSSLYKDIPPSLIVNYFKNMIDLNVPHGKKIRGRTVLASYRAFMKNDVTLEGLRKACILGWCIEWMQGGFLIHDDIMDESELRRGQPCWYRVTEKDYGMISINDGLHLSQSVFMLLRIHFRDHPRYGDIVNLFTSSSFNTTIGQCMDMLTTPKKINYADYTEERYKDIVQWKTSYYTANLPVAAGMILAGVTDTKAFEDAQTILLKIGEYFQIQDDYLDCFGEPEVIGKVGRDIEEGKCCWPIVQALKIASEEQRQIIKENYGIDDPDRVARVKKVYQDINIPELYSMYETAAVEELNELIDSLCPRSNLPKSVFSGLLNKLLRRRK